MQPCFQLPSHSYSVAVSVVPGPPSLPNCYAAIRVSTMQAGDPDARIVVVLRDEYSNPTPALAPLAATAIPDISGANISLPYQVFSSNPYDTRYSFSLAGLVKAGGYSLVVSYDGVILINGSARVSVTPAQVSARDSRVVGYAAGTPYDDDGSPPAEVFTVLTAGVAYSLIVVASDAYGNLHTTSTPGFRLDEGGCLGHGLTAGVVRDTGSGGGTVDVALGGHLAFVSNCTASSSFDPGNGRTRLTYQVRRTGTFTVSVLTAAGELVSRGMVQVLPGPVDISSIQASWDDTQLPVAGRPLTLEVALRDQFSNPLTSSSASSLVALLLPTSAPLPSRSRRHLAQQTLPPLPLPAQPTAAGQRYGQQQPGAMLLGATPMLLHASYAVGEATRAAAATPGVKQQAGHISEEQAEGELQWVSGGEQAAGQAAQPDSCAPSRRRVLQLSPSATPVTVLGSQAGFNQST
ncbi:hypothetical protein QJQ45_023796, partial [Haematococcus lacustris]